MKRTLKHISYAMGNFVNTIAYQVFGNRIQFYYVDLLGLNAATAGILWTIYGLWNAINDMDNTAILVTALPFQKVTEKLRLCSKAILWQPSFYVVVRLL